MLVLLLIGGAATLAGYMYSKSKDEEEKLIQIAQDHRARAARLQLEYERCSQQLAAANPLMTPKVMMKGDNRDIEEGGEEGKNI